MAEIEELEKIRELIEEIEEQDRKKEEGEKHQDKSMINKFIENYNSRGKIAEEKISELDDIENLLYMRCSMVTYRGVANDLELMRTANPSFSQRKIIMMKLEHINKIIKKIKDMLENKDELLYRSFGKRQKLILDIIKNDFLLFLNSDDDIIKRLEGFQKRSEERNKEVQEALKIDSRTWLVTMKAETWDGDEEDD